MTSTVTIPAGTRLVGEAWSVLAGRGPAFEDQDNPQVIFKVGEEGSQGIIEITDVVFSTVGPGKFLTYFIMVMEIDLMKTCFASCWCDYRGVEYQGTRWCASRCRNVGYSFQVCVSTNEWLINLKIH